VTITGLDSRPRDIYGEDSLQALALGLRLVAAHLSDFTGRGGRLLHPEGREPFPVGAYFPEPGQAGA
jgi:hypothetical protein